MESNHVAIGTGSVPFAQRGKAFLTRSLPSGPEMFGLCKEALSIRIEWPSYGTDCWLPVSNRHQSRRRIVDRHAQFKEE